MRGAVIVMVAAMMSSCVPWTVRPIEKEGAGAFDAARYVDSIWDSKVVPSAGLVQGVGTVVRVEPGALVIDRQVTLNRDNQVTVLTGPVIRGTALRDALPFIQFSQFVNQLEFARVGNALNERAVRVAQAAIGSGDVVGSMVRYSGAGARKGDVLDVVPVTLEIVRGKQ